jgi:hypothetical protein
MAHKQLDIESRTYSDEVCGRDSGRGMCEHLRKYFCRLEPGYSLSKGVTGQQREQTQLAQHVQSILLFIRPGVIHYTNSFATGQYTTFCVVESV